MADAQNSMVEVQLNKTISYFKKSKPDLQLSLSHRCVGPVSDTIGLIKHGTEKPKEVKNMYTWKELRLASSSRDKNKTDKSK